MNQEEYYDFCNRIRARLRDEVLTICRGACVSRVNNYEDRLEIRIENKSHNFQFDYEVDDFLKKASTSQDVVKDIVAEMLPVYRKAVLKAFFR